jgi:hypothetical protein
MGFKLFIMRIRRSTATTLYMVFVFIIVFLYSGGCNGQSSAVTIKNYSVKNLSTLNLDLERVQIKSSLKGSSTITVERHIRVSHSTLDKEILIFVKNSGVYNEQALVDMMDHSLNLSRKPSSKAFIARGEEAIIEIIYIIIVPEHINIFNI